MLQTPTATLRHGLLLSVALLATLVLVSCGSSPTQTTTATGPTETETEAATMLEFIDNSPQLSTLSAGIGAADLTKRFEAKGQYTIFAPNNAAWAKLGEDRMEALMTTESKNLRQGILNHTVQGHLITDNLVDGFVVKTLGGPTLKVKVVGDKILVNGAQIVVPDQSTGNGVVQIINKVIR